MYKENNKIIEKTTQLNVWLTLYWDSYEIKCGFEWRVFKDKRCELNFVSKKDNDKIVLCFEVFLRFIDVSKANFVHKFVKFNYKPYCELLWNWKLAK